MTSGLVTLARLHDAGGGTPLLSTATAQFVGSGTTTLNP